MRRLSHRNDQARLNRSKRYRTGFTLVELLVVIAIIGVLVGLTVPAMFAVRRTFNNASVKFEVQALEDAVEKYRTKYGEYPPDGSSWPIMEAHLRKAFPGILQSELLLVNSVVPAIRNDYDGRVMDPAEAVVFFLGGFSTDSQKPFSGKGGPFLNTGTAASPVWVYNGSRENELYAFKSERLVFTDESARGATPDDLFPVYSSYLTTTPYVYFDSRTYQFARGGSVFCNYHRATPPDAIMGVARPLLSAAPSGTSWYENPKKFQIMSPGIDGLYGWDLQPNSGTPILFSVTGQGYSFTAGTPGSWQINSNANRFRLAVHAPKLPMQDNVTNCIEPPTFSDAAK